MSIHDFADPQLWAMRQWEQADLGDVRRNARAVSLGAALVAQPQASLPAQAGGWAELKAAYRLLNEADVTHQALSQPHWQTTRAQAADTSADVVLFIQDTTELDFTGHRRAQGLGHIGDSNGAGLLLHSCLSLLPGGGSPPEQAAVLGLAAQKVWARPPRGREGGKETRAQRRKRPTESDVWAEMVEAIGPAPAGGPLWVSVGDRGSDIFSYLRRVRAKGWHCLVRLCQDRLVQNQDGTSARLKSWLRSLPAQGQKPLALRGREGQPGRTVRLSVAWAPVTILPPAQGAERKQAPSAGWCLRCWECEATPSGKPLEWLLFTTVPVTTTADALQAVDWYAHRWVIEEYHKCLKSGCSMERRQLRTAAGLQALLGLLAIVSVRLLQLRTLSRSTPHQPAQSVVPPVMLQVLAARLKKPPASLTLGEFWQALAGMGGFLGRKSDGSPGWQTLWRGWQRIQDMCWGAGIALEDAHKCG